MPAAIFRQEVRPFTDKQCNRPLPIPLRSEGEPNCKRELMHRRTRGAQVALRLLEHLVGAGEQRRAGYRRHLCRQIYGPNKKAKAKFESVLRVSPSRRTPWTSRRCGRRRGFCTPTQLIVYVGSITCFAATASFGGCPTTLQSALEIGRASC